MIHAILVQDLLLILPFLEKGKLRLQRLNFQITVGACLNSGKYILISTNAEYLLLLDSTDGHVVQRLSGHSNQSNLPLEASFTPDAKYIICGSGDGPVHIWEVATGIHLHSLDFHVDSPKVVKFNPTYAMFASADVNLAFWIPSF